MTTIDLRNNRQLNLTHNGGTATIQPLLGQGAQGLPGVGSTAWVPAESVTTGTKRRAPDGSWISSLATRTTRATFDATEQGFWETILTKAGTLEASAVSTMIDGRVPAAVPVASTSAQGKVELATTAETAAGTDTARAVTPAAAFPTFAPKQVPPTTAVATGIYDRRLNVYNLKPTHLRKTRARLAAARAGVGLCTWAWCGDSTVAGVGAAVATTSLPAQVAALLSARGVPLSGSGPVLGTYGTTNDARVAKTGTWGARSGDANMAFTVTGGDSVTFTFTATDGIQLVLYFGRKSTAFTVKVDGVDISSGTTVGGTRSSATITPDNTEALGSYTSPALSAGAHTIQVTLTTGTGNRLEIVGAEQNARATGLRMMNFGVGSTKIAALAATGTNWFKNGQLPVAASPAGFAADLVVLDMEINDATPGGPTAVATYKATYQTAITNLKSNGADLVLHTSNPCSGYDFTAYTQAIYELADTNDLPVIDFQDRWGSYSSANGYGMMFDSLHPNPTGYAEKAQAIITALGMAA